jgi:predicted DNA-binding transcriptional regulator AlpA
MQKTRLKITEAATLYGIARTTIYKRIKEGKLSVDTDKRIDLSELMRVFGAIPSQLQKQTTVESVAIQSDEIKGLQDKITRLEQELAVAIADKKKLEAENNLLKSQALEKADADKLWLKQLVDANQLKLLEHKPPPPPKNGLFNKLVKAITG